MDKNVYGTMQVLVFISEADFVSCEDKLLLQSYYKIFHSFQIS